MVARLRAAAGAVAGAGVAAGRGRRCTGRSAPACRPRAACRCRASVPLQVWQVAQAALPQQTPSTQLPLMHWLPAVHARPFALSAQLLGAVPGRCTARRSRVDRAVGPAGVAAADVGRAARRGRRHAAARPVAVRDRRVGRSRARLRAARDAWSRPAGRRRRRCTRRCCRRAGWACSGSSCRALPAATLAQLPALVPTLHAWQSRARARAAADAVDADSCRSGNRRSPCTTGRGASCCRRGWSADRRCLGDRQSASRVHAALHAVVPLHTYGAQAMRRRGLADAEPVAGAAGGQRRLAGRARRRRARRAGAVQAAGALAVADAVGAAGRRALVRAAGQDVGGRRSATLLQTPRDVDSAHDLQMPVQARLAADALLAEARRGTRPCSAQIAPVGLRPQRAVAADGGRRAVARRRCRWPCRRRCRSGTGSTAVVAGRDAGAGAVAGRQRP